MAPSFDSSPESSPYYFYLLLPLVLPKVPIMSKDKGKERLCGPTPSPERPLTLSRMKLKIIGPEEARFG